MHINNMISKKMLIKKILLNAKRNLFNVLSIFNKLSQTIIERLEMVRLNMLSKKS